jgi:hypothetical protein
MNRSRDSKPRPVLGAAVAGLVSGIVRSVLTWLRDALDL